MLIDRIVMPRQLTSSPFQIEACGTPKNFTCRILYGAVFTLSFKSRFRTTRLHGNIPDASEQLQISVENMSDEWLEGEKTLLDVLRCAIIAILRVSMAFQSSHLCSRFGLPAAALFGLRWLTNFLLRSRGHWSYVWERGWSAWVIFG